MQKKFFNDTGFPNVSDPYCQATLVQLDRFFKVILNPKRKLVKGIIKVNGAIGRKPKKFILRLWITSQLNVVFVLCFDETQFS